ncbi:3'(2'),5'-bisphosphate nucleotidase 1-like isoform X2 [Stegodyphus dumicola]|uniref:3'(2'),5'-bisphosphate nucleotidase 1-like isoform X2 n=1 Tax=Stegodyphus dumicola TaxID=202533 RepID=UPI0015A8C7E2|nr:3'(2'),5'-bisphosphate nucleotidase 1-like isoform X2 [Stegodyphus dumicola]
MAVQIAKGSLFMHLMSASVAVANHAGKIIREIMRKGNLGIVEKTLEAVDHEQPIVNLSDCEAINVECPEHLASIKEEEVVIWVDPLDGTAEYTQGLLDHVTVLIGLAVNGKAVGGVIHQPYYNYKNQEDILKLGRTIWGIVGVGSSGIDHCMPPVNKRIITTTRSHSNPIINSTIAALHPDEVLKVGGAGHKVLLLIEGKAHAYVFPSKGCKKWDTCAPEALLHAFGGKLTDIHGQPLQYHAQVEHVNSSGVLATYLESVHDCLLVSSIITSVMLGNMDVFCHREEKVMKVFKETTCRLFNNFLRFVIVKNKFSKLLINLRNYNIQNHYFVRSLLA